MPIVERHSLLAPSALAKADSVLETKALQPSLLNAFCLLLEQNKDQLEALSRAKDALEFLANLKSGLSLVKSVGGYVFAVADAATFLVRRVATKIEIVRTDPQDGVVHYQHPDDYEGEKYLHIAARALFEFEWVDDLVGCLQGAGLDVPRSGPLKDIPVTIDIDSLAPHFWMTSDFGVHTAPVGAPGGRWEGRTDQAGVVQFKLRAHTERPPSGRGEVRQEAASFAVTANPYDVSNVVAAVANLLDLAPIEATGVATASWHADSV